MPFGKRDLARRDGCAAVRRDVHQRAGLAGLARVGEEVEVDGADVAVAVGCAQQVVQRPADDAGRVGEGRCDAIAHRYDATLEPGDDQQRSVIEPQPARDRAAMNVNGLGDAVRADPVDGPGVDVAEIERVAEPARRFREDERLLLQQSRRVAHLEFPLLGGSEAHVRRDAVGARLI